MRITLFGKVLLLQLLHLRQRARQTEREREWEKTVIVCVFVFECHKTLKHNSIVQIFIEQLPFWKVHLIKLYTFTLHILKLDFATTNNGFMKYVFRDINSIIYILCLKSFYDQSTEKQLPVLRSSIRYRVVCHRTMFINLLARPL